MISIKTFMELVEHRITEGDSYGWNCYGQDAHQLSSWNGIHGHGGWSANIVFDTKNQTVFEVEVCDYTNDRAYRIINSEFKKAHDEELSTRGHLDQAWDDVDFIDLEVDQDWIDKATAIVSGVDYDTRVRVPLELEDHELFKLMTMAHEQDITFNQLVENLIRSVIEKEKSNGR